MPLALRVNEAQLTNSSSSDFSNTFLKCFMQQADYSTPKEWSLVLGSDKDNFLHWNESQSIIFSMTLGIGKPPYDDVSIWIVLALYAGLGAPFLILSITLTYVTSRRIQRKCLRPSQMLIEEDDMPDY